MATGSAIDRLSQRIDAIVARRRPRYRAADIREGVLERALERALAESGRPPLSNEEMRNSPARFMTDDELIGILLDSGTLTATDFK
jgi:hypothetical protein